MVPTTTESSTRTNGRGPRKTETLAVRVVERLLAGSRMRFVETQSHGEHDFNLVLAAGDIVPLEVTEVASAEWRAMSAALDKTRFIPRRLCQNDWRVTPEPGSNVKRLVAKLDASLAAIEAEGITKFFASRHASESSAVRRIWEDLGITAGGVLPTSRPGISIGLPPRGGLISSRFAIEAAEHAAWRDDNRRKLRSHASGRGDLFVWISDDHKDAWMGMTERSPTHVPSLPEEVSCLWLATLTPGGAEFIVWRTDGQEWRCDRFSASE